PFKQQCRARGSERTAILDHVENHLCAVLLARMSPLKIQRDDPQPRSFKRRWIAGSGEVDALKQYLDMLSTGFLQSHLEVRSHVQIDIAADAESIDMHEPFHIEISRVVS